VMTRSEKENLIRTACLDNERSGGGLVLWSGHAVARLVRMPCSRVELERATSSAEIIEDYPEEHRVLPDCLVLGFVSGKIPFHAVVALDPKKGRIVVVTIYRPEPSRWSNDWRKRK
jgi:hypothetical protein